MNRQIITIKAINKTSMARTCQPSVCSKQISDHSACRRTDQSTDSPTKNICRHQINRWR